MGVYDHISMGYVDIDFWYHHNDTVISESSVQSFDEIKSWSCCPIMVKNSTLITVLFPLEIFSTRLYKQTFVSIVWYHQYLFSLKYLDKISRSTCTHL